MSEKLKRKIKRFKTEMNHVFINLLQAIFHRKLCIIFLAALFEMHRVKYI